MGLDLVELLMEVEEAFGISIPDEDAPAVETVGSFHDCLLRQLGTHQQTGCLTAVAFYQVRRALISVLGLPRKQLRPSTNLRQLIPVRGRRATWKRLQDSLGLKLPKLSLPMWSVVFTLAAPFVVGLGCRWVPTLLGHSAATAGWFPYLAGVLTLVIALMLGNHFASGLHANLQTVGGLARGVLANNYAALAAQVGGSHEKDVWNALQFIICEQFDLKPEQVTRETRLVDLGSG